MDNNWFQNEILPRNAPDATPGSPLFIGSLSKAMRVLYAFGGNKARAHCSGIAREAGWGRVGRNASSSVSHALGILAKDGRSKQYRLSVRLLDFAYLFLRSYPLSTVTLPSARRSRNENGFSPTL